MCCFCHTFDCFQHVVSMWFESFHTEKTSLTGQQLALWLLMDMLFSLFWGAYITPFWWVLSFQNSAVIHKVAQHVIYMQIRYILIYVIHHIRTGPLHMVTSGQITVTLSSHQFETQGTKTQAKRWLTVLHRTQSIANIPAKTVNN